MPKTVAQAVMFCLMDVSSSMSEHMKDLAKRFYMLLYVFLTRRYRHVEIVFIRHTDRAEEVDEDTFFHGPESGGTLVSSALQAMHEIVRSRFRPADWKIYPNQIEVITAEQMLDAYSSAGMPRFYKHWSFGKHFAHHEAFYRIMGLAYEIVINTHAAKAH